MEIVGNFQSASPIDDDDPYRTGPWRPHTAGWDAELGCFLFDGLVQHDLKTGTEEHYSFGAGVDGSETVMAPRIGAAAEDDGYRVTLTTDMNDAARVVDGPGCKLALPERISSGTHSRWVAGAETAAATVGL